jgi:DNA-binding MarR family transcriptional regulator
MDVQAGPADAFALVVEPGSAQSWLFGQIARLTEAVQELTKHLSLSQPVAASEPEPPTSTETAESAALAAAKRLLVMRRGRDRTLGPGLSTDPAWDMLVELYVAHAAGTGISVGNACIASGVPITSALRWCEDLQKRGMVTRQRDCTDRRRVLLRLTDATYEQMTGILATG